jgi:hypothetical protein
LLTSVGKIVSLNDHGDDAADALMPAGPQILHTIHHRGAASCWALSWKFILHQFFPYRSWQRHGRLALRYGRPLEQRTVERNVVRGHARGRKSLLEPSPNGAAIECKHLRQHPHRLVHRIDDGACDALVDDFRNGTTAEGKDGIQSLRSSLRDSRSSRSMLISCHGVDARPISSLAMHARFGRHRLQTSNRGRG